METNTIEIWMLSAIAAAAITLAIMMVIWLSGKRESYDNVPDRYKYPKKDCECDCLGEHPVNTDDEFITISRGRKIRNPDYRCSAGNYVHNACMGDIPVEYYMRRGDKVYLRGEGVKVVITVKK